MPFTESHIAVIETALTPLMHRLRQCNNAHDVIFAIFSLKDTIFRESDTEDRPFSELLHYPEKQFDMSLLLDDQIDRLFQTLRRTRSNPELHDQLCHILCTQLHNNLTSEDFTDSISDTLRKAIKHYPSENCDPVTALLHDAARILKEENIVSSHDTDELDALLAFYRDLMLSELANATIGITETILLNNCQYALSEKDKTDLLNSLNPGLSSQDKQQIIHALEPLSHCLKFEALEKTQEEILTVQKSLFLEKSASYPLLCDLFIPGTVSSGAYEARITPLLRFTGRYINYLIQQHCHEISEDNQISIAFPKAAIFGYLMMQFHPLEQIAGTFTETAHLLAHTIQTCDEVFKIHAHHPEIKKTLASYEHIHDSTLVPLLKREALMNQHWPFVCNYANNSPEDRITRSEHRLLFSRNLSIYCINVSHFVEQVNVLTIPLQNQIAPPHALNHAQVVANAVGQAEYPFHC